MWLRIFSLSSPINLVEEEAKPEPEEAKTETTECKYHIHCNYSNLLIIVSLYVHVLLCKHVSYADILDNVSIYAMAENVSFG